MKTRPFTRFAIPLFIFFALSAFPQARERWTEAQANDWYAHQPWLVGSDYIPSYAINQLEMWQADTFNSQRIDTELGWAESLGMNTMRVFLHDLLWKQDPDGFRDRMTTFLGLCAKHHIRPIFVLFDSVWDPDPKLGPQHPPIPGVHNSGWVQSPGRAALADPAEYPRLEAYVTGVIGAFANDPRVLAWDLWNEPDNGNDPSTSRRDPPINRLSLRNFCPKFFPGPAPRVPRNRSPVASGMATGPPSKPSPPSSARRWKTPTFSPSTITAGLRISKPTSSSSSSYHRPILCTEYMARGNGSTFDTILPLAHKYHVAAINWGFAQGKTQTWYPWDSWTRPYTLEQPAVWHHDIFTPDGKPYRQHEIDLIRALTSATNGPAKTTPPQ